MFVEGLFGGVVNFMVACRWDVSKFVSFPEDQSAFEAVIVRESQGVKPRCLNQPTSTASEECSWDWPWEMRWELRWKDSA